MQALVVAMEAAGGPTDLATHRLLADQFCDLHPVDPSVVVEPTRVAQVPAQWVYTPSARAGGAVLYFHSGGYAAGSPGIAAQLAGRLSAAARLPFLIPAYRLAPEHPFPAALQDGLAAYRWLVEDRTPAALVVAGASAGGGLALATLVAARDAGIPLPAAAFLLSPWVDLSLSLPSMRAVASNDRTTSPDYLAELAALYAPGVDRHHPGISPLYADLHGLPPMHIEVGSEERLVDDSRELDQRARAAGVNVHLQIVDGAVHTFPHGAPHTPEARAAIERIAAHMHAHVAT